MRLRLAAGTIIAAVAIAGCSDSGSDVNPAKDRSTEVSELQKKVRDLRDRVASREAAREEEAKSTAATGVAEAHSSMDRMLSSLPGSAGLVIRAPGGEGPRLGGGRLTTGPAWSTIKIPVAERILADNGGPKGISPAQREQIHAAITLSDNDAAAALFSDLESAHGGLNGASEAVGEMLRQAGDSQTRISTKGREGFTTYGQTDWSLAEQNRYMAALAGGCISDAASRNLMLDEMAQVTAEPWGLGAAGVPAKWKGGWGPGTDGKYLVRQMGVIESGNRELVVTLAAVADDGSFGSAQAMATRIARWAATNPGDDGPSAAAC